MNKIHAKIITPAGVLYSDDVDMVVMPGSEGELGVMAGHVPMIVQLKAGEVRLYNGTNHKPFVINNGIAHITGDGVSIVFQ
jgi:F-type H+-transporting ATPase subunit epsilon